MKKFTYTAPKVEITKWERQDIITTSGEQLVTDNAVANIGDTNYTKQISYSDLS